MIQVGGIEYAVFRSLKKHAILEENFCDLFRGGSQDIKLEKFIKTRYPAPFAK